jgi:hypothetical protein
MCRRDRAARYDDNKRPSANIKAGPGSLHELDPGGDGGPIAADRNVVMLR